MTHGQFVRTLIISGLILSGGDVVAEAQSVAGGSAVSAPQAMPGTPAVPVPSPAIVAQPAFQGSVPLGNASTTPIALTLGEAISRGLKANLGLLTSEQAGIEARAQRAQALSAILPTVTGTISENLAQSNLDTFGFNFPSVPNSPFHIPKIIGPFGYSEAQANANFTASLSSWRNLRSSSERQKAAHLSVEDARDLVVQAVGNAYLAIIASAARIQSTEAQVKTAQVLFERASDQKKAGTAPGIDVLRSQVELKRQQQLLVVEKNQFERDKLTLARVIGLPVGQDFTVADPTPSIPLEAMSLDDALTKAYAKRADYQAAQIQVDAAEEAVKAAKAQWIPTLGASGFYGDAGKTFGNSHGVFAFAGSLNFNIFNGGRIRSEVQQQQAELTNRKNELANLKGRIDYDVRNALLDLKASNEQVDVARSNVDLAKQELTQAQDRFTSGVADNLEVVQAQQSVADADENLISALYQNNVAKVELARALGMAEEGMRNYFSQTPAKRP